MNWLVLALSERRHRDGHGFIVRGVQLNGQNSPVGGGGAGDRHAAPLGRDGVDVSVDRQEVRVVPVVGEVLHDDAAGNLRKLIHASQPNGLSGHNTGKKAKIRISCCSTLKPNNLKAPD